MGICHTSYGKTQVSGYVAFLSKPPSNAWTKYCSYHWMQ